MKGEVKSYSTKDILGEDINPCKKWIEFPLAPGMTWLNIETDHVKPISMFDVSDNEQLKEVWCWKNTQPLLKQDHQHKGAKYNFLDYRLQFIKTCQHSKLNEERLNEDLL